jgi:hypothetical protein
MKTGRKKLLTVIILVACFLIAGVERASHVAAEGCVGGFLRGSIAGEANRVKLSLEGRNPGCGPPHVQKIAHQLQSFFTYEISCSTDRQAAGAGLCSTTPCPDFGRFFAFRTIHHPDGSSAPAGFSCVALEQATATPGITVAQVFEAVRRVRLPGGEIGVEPGVRGLANLESYFWVEGVEQAPVDLQVGGSTVHAEFRVVEYRWSFGGNEPVVTEGPGRPGLESEVNTTFRRRGVYPVEVTVVWAAEAFLDGRRVGEVDDLVSRAEMSYPVAELRTVLTG